MYMLLVSILSPFTWTYFGLRGATCTGVDLSKILGGQTKIYAWVFLNYWGHVPGLPPKSTPMVTWESSGSSVECFVWIGRPKCKEDTSPSYCRANVYARPDLCQRQDMATYCCYSCSFL